MNVTSRSYSSSDSDSISITSTSENDCGDQSDYSLKAEPILYTRQKVDRRKKATWHLKAKADQNFAEYIFTLFLKESLHEVKSLSLDRGIVPVCSLIQENAYLFPRVVLPLVVQELVYRFAPQYGNWSRSVGIAVYSIGFLFALLSSVARISSNCVKYGTLDEKNVGRDRCSDEDVNQAALGLAITPLVRLGGALTFWWNKSSGTNLPSSQFDWTFPIRMILFFLVDDLVFYTYHRASHEVPWLWSIHQKHHTTRHPSANLSILADQVQEFIEILLVPLIASLAIPMTFHEIFVTLSYVMAVEVGGHSGMRVAQFHPILHPFLQPFGAALNIEDHDLHHRHGKSGKSYGKQSLLWDRIFGTREELVECAGLR